MGKGFLIWGSKDPSRSCKSAKEIKAGWALKALNSFALTGPALPRFLIGAAVLVSVFGLAYSEDSNRQEWFVKNGKPLLIDERSLLGISKQADSYLEIQSASFKDAPEYGQYYISIGVRASRFLAEGDFHVRTRLGLKKRNDFAGPVVLSMQVGMQFFDFLFRDGKILLKGIQLDSVRYQKGSQSSASVSLDGEPFTLELLRRGPRVEIKVNGKSLASRELEPTRGDLAITVERETLLRVSEPEDRTVILRIYDFATEGHFVSKSEEELEWDRMLGVSLLQIKRVGGVYRYVEDRPKYPNVLLIGDSISLYYTDPVRRALKGRADVYHTPMGPGKVETLFSSLDTFLPWKHWDLIHFNTGLHDFGKKQGTAEEVAAYQRNLEIVIGKLKKTGARLIWASTTPVPPDSPGTSNELAIRYNRAAAELMRRHSIPINDLHTPMLPHHEKYWLAPKNVHFNSSGSAFLGQLVAASIDRELKKLSL